MENQQKEKDKRIRVAPPNALALLETLRGVGYTTATAIADIIDNSITARANKIEIDFCWEEKKSIISIFDNGKGMDVAELENAMRLGFKSPKIKRDAYDLGRYGIGLKTASLSQCRRLTVVSKKDNNTNCLRWDLDYLEEKNDGEWYLLEEPETGSEQYLTKLKKINSGTIVLWEQLDRVVPLHFTEQNFLDLIDKVEKHIAMVFHRYIVNDEEKITILINGFAVKPMDPFLTKHPFTRCSPTERIIINNYKIEVQCFLLPTRDKLSEQEYEMHGGPDGWITHQGFYIYRNKRLLVAGNWLGLGNEKGWTKDEAFQLARIRIEIPNTADSDWKIDIKKSVARPPLCLKSKLVRIAADTRVQAKKIFVHRNKYKLVKEEKMQLPIWKTSYNGEEVKYEIDRKHSYIKLVIENAEKFGLQLNYLLNLIEETVPIQKIIIENTDKNQYQNPICTEQTFQKIKEILPNLFTDLMKRESLTPIEAKNKICMLEPFDQFPELVNELAKNFGVEKL